MTYDPQDTSNFYPGVRSSIRIGTEFNDATAVENKPVYARVYGMDESETVRECDRDACVKDENFYRRSPRLRFKCHHSAILSSSDAISIYIENIEPEP